MGDMHNMSQLQKMVNMQPARLGTDERVFLQQQQQPPGLSAGAGGDMQHLSHPEPGALIPGKTGAAAGRGGVGAVVSFAGRFRFLECFGVSSVAITFSGIAIFHSR